MNQERIRELAEEADIQFYKSYVPETGFKYEGAEVTVEDLEKFAELIVRECALTLYKNAVQDKQAGFAHEAKIMELAGDIVKQHFGVK